VGDFTLKMTSTVPDCPVAMGLGGASWDTHAMTPGITQPSGNGYLTLTCVLDSQKAEKLSKQMYTTGWEGCR
jgi:hypothetical protein